MHLCCQAKKSDNATVLIPFVKRAPDLEVYELKVVTVAEKAEVKLDRTCLTQPDQCA